MNDFSSFCAVVNLTIAAALIYCDAGRTTGVLIGLLVVTGFAWWVAHQQDTSEPWTPATARGKGHE